ncbi:MAG: diphthine synthase [Candidatus Micrarchaeota archaeon]|nr:diphthine synthase [Candidatus Micrarchaeota archaeon]
MATFYLIGLGIGSASGLSLEALKILKKINKIFIERYTSFLEEEEVKKIENILSKKIILLEREEVENEKIILDQLEKEDCALIVCGDPLIATTHISLVISCKKLNHKIKIIHNSSILSAAISTSGLQVYRFGKICTIAYWKEKYQPTSFLKIIKTNKKIDAHSLCLLDIDKELGAMSAKKALEIIFLAQKKAKQKILTQKDRIIVLSCLGRENQKIWAGRIEKLLEKKEDIVGPAVIIIPSKMHFVEEEYFQILQKESD